MNDRMPESLRSLLAQHGPFLYEDPRRLRALLADECPGCKREIHVLVVAAELKVPAELDRRSAHVPWPMLEARLFRQLVDDAGLAEDSARWAVRTWAAALGIPIPTLLPDEENVGVTSSQVAPITVTPIDDQTSRSRVPSSGHPSLFFSPVPTILNRMALGCGLCIVFGGLLMLIIVYADPFGSRKQRVVEDRVDVPVADIRSGIGFLADPDTMRWENDRIVQEVSLLNNDEDLSDFDARLSVSFKHDNQWELDDWKHQVSFRDWKKGERKTITAPAGKLALFGLAGTARKRNTLVQVNVLQQPLGPGTVVPFRGRAPFEPVIDRYPTHFLLKIKRVEEPLFDVDGFVTCFKENGELPAKLKIFRASWQRGESIELTIGAFKFPRIEFLAIARRQTNPENMAKGLPEPRRVLIREVWSGWQWSESKKK